MKKFANLLHEKIEWKQDGFWAQSYTLYHHDTPLAMLKQDQGIFSMDGSIYLPDETKPRYQFRPKGFLKRHLEVDTNDFEYAPAKLTPHRWGGGLKARFTSGNAYEWQRTDFWGRQWTLTDHNDQQMATLTVGSLGQKGTLTILSDAPPPAELAQLIFAGWYQLIVELQMATG